MKTRADWIWLVVVAVGSFAVSLACRFLFPDPATPEFLKNVELAGVVTSAVAVYLVVRQHILAFPIGIVSLAIYAYFFFSKGWFGDAGLQIFFLAAQFHGWYSWSRGGDQGGELRVQRATARQWVWLSIGVALLFAALYPILIRIEGKNPLVDGSTTAISLVAQYMVNRKFLENWIVWIVVDLVYVPWYWMANAKPTAILYTVFLILAAAGYREWRAKISASEASS